jgi:hypothetical protein
MIVQIYCRNKPAKKTINPYKFLKLKQYLRNSFVVYIGINLRCLSGDIYIYMIFPPWWLYLILDCLILSLLLNRK